MKVLVTGASGFIGRALVTALQERHDVRAPRRTELDLLDDAAVGAWLRRERPDAIVHAATTPGHRNAPPVADLAARNLRMFHALSLRDDCWGRFVLLGSGSEYDAARCPARVREEQLGQFVPTDPNGLSKLTLSRLAARDPRFTVLRAFGVYGPHEDWQIRLLSNAVCKALLGKPITLRQNRRFDYVAVEDLARVVAHFVEHRGARESYNVTPDEPVELLTAVRLVRELVDARLEVRVATPGLGLEYSGCNARLRSELPELELTPLRAGLERLIAFWSANQQVVRPELLDVDK